MPDADDRSWINGWPGRDPDALDVLSIIERGGYAVGDRFVDLGARLAAVRGATTSHVPRSRSEAGPLRDETDPRGRRPVVSVTGETTQEAALRLRDRRDGVAVLNFASAVNPGGGFMWGARAQEEDLCRCSTLFDALATQRSFYERHRESGDPLHSDAAIRAPEVPFFRLRADGLLLPRPFTVTVLTAAAPNLGHFVPADRPGPDELRALFVRRWRGILHLAATHGDRALVLGAWGCGAFRNDPDLVAAAAREAIDSSPEADVPAEIVFAIPDRGTVGRANHVAFRRCLGDARGEG